MTGLKVILALCNLGYSAYGGPLLPRQGCAAGSTTRDGSGQTLTCGGDGRYYDGNGQLVQANQIVSVIQPSGQGCTRGTTTIADKNGQTITCGGDGRYYDGNGQPVQANQIVSVVQPVGQGCTEGTTSSDANGQMITCGGDGRYYDGSGQPFQPSQGSPGSQQSQQGCVQGITISDMNGQTLTCGGDGRYYDTNGQSVTQNGQSVSSQKQNSQSQNSQQNPSAVQQPGSGGAPDGYSVGFSTQDYERPGQQSGCSTYCSANSFIHANNQIGPGGALAAAINPAMLGGDVCATCGICFNVINAGIAAPDGPGGPSPQLAANQQIKVWIVNSCTNCAIFDINDCPAGWDNPKVYYQQAPC